ncbi:MAG: hypothetical protein MJ159_04205 [Treponemataceae bacterium]|nr:hypothetical protein [Treponemataceae bacterium]
MKKIICGVLIITFCLFSLSAKDVFIGNWELEILGSSEKWIFTHDDTASSITANNRTIKQRIVIDETEQTIVIPLLTELADSFSYVLNEDGIIDLYVPGEFNVDFSAFLTQNLDVENAQNSVTADAYKKLIIAMEKAMHDIPIIRLRKI